jgi:predicted enzyme related to lactoylglutathione lyase
MNRVVHFEVGAQDPARAAAFYQNAFGWEIKKWEGPKNEPGIDGGILRHQDGAARTVNTVGVDSIEDAAAKVVAAGGKVVVQKMAVPGVGWLAYCTDTEGGIFGIFKADPSAT